MYHQHLESLCKKLTSRVALLRWLAGSGWGAGATTVCTVTLALVHSTAEYCAAVWCRNAHTHLIDPAINDALRIMTGNPPHNISSYLPRNISSSDNNNIRAPQWADHQGNAEWADNPTRLRIFIPDTDTHPPTPE